MKTILRMLGLYSVCCVEPIRAWDNRTYYCIGCQERTDRHVRN